MPYASELNSGRTRSQITAVHPRVVQATRRQPPRRLGELDLLCYL